MATLKEISLLANVSISTVSKALNGSDEISESTRNEILQIAKSLNYKTKEQKIIPSNEKTIAVICPELNSNYYAQLLNHINEYIISKGYYSMLALSFFSAAKEAELLKEFIRKSVDGILLITENKHAAELFHQTKTNHTPIVIIANSAGEIDIPEHDVIQIDEEYGIDLAIQHLVELGHRKIAYAGDLLSESRYHIYSSLLGKYGLHENKEYTITSALRFEEAGYQAMNEILLAKEKPTALFAAYDDIAIGAMKAIYEKKFAIPEAISIVGFDNIFVSPYLPIGLTTISNPIKEMARTSCTILLSKMKHPENTVVQHVTLKPGLIIRDSTAPV
ncbi:MAG: LacI family DNA-binding transcriptional regulator [Roseburia sp.]|nr:LacI family DNA-binding transcriptional regulator [Roseburia sp.]